MPNISDCSNAPNVSERPKLMAREPEVDVLLPVKSPAPWLEATLRGLLDQRSSEWRLVAVVHGAAENEIELIRKYVPNAHIVVAQVDLTLVEVLNFGLSECKAEFVARMDSDDIALPGRFECQIDFLKNHPDKALVASPIVIVDEHGVVQRRSYGPKTSSSLNSKMRWKNVIAHPSVMMRRKVVLDLGGYSATAKHVEDYCLWLEMGALYELATLEIPLTKYRIHANQVTQTKVIGRLARERVLKARVNFARGRDESVLMARFRHMIWSSRQVLRELGKRTH